MPRGECFKYSSGNDCASICINYVVFYLYGSDSLFQFEDILLRVGEEHLEKSNDRTIALFSSHTAASRHQDII